MSALRFHQSPRGCSPSSCSFLLFSRWTKALGNIPFLGEQGGWGPLPGAEKGGVGQAVSVSALVSQQPPQPSQHNSKNKGDANS